MLTMQKQIFPYINLVLFKESCLYTIYFYRINLALLI